MTSPVQERSDQHAVPADSSGLTRPSLGERGADIGRRPVTGALIAANVIGYLAMLVCLFHHMGADIFMHSRILASFGPEELLRCGANYGPYSLAGQSWRLMTCLFMHSGFLHLAWNMFFLWGLGRQLEMLLGGAKTLAVYLLSGIGGSLASAWFDPTMVSVGASGCIAGIAGYLLAVMVFAKPDLPMSQRRSIWLWAVFLMPLSIISGFFSEHTDNAGHLGGLVSGALIGATGVFRVVGPNGLLRNNLKKSGAP